MMSGYACTKQASLSLNPAVNDSVVNNWFTGASCLSVAPFIPLCHVIIHVWWWDSLRGMPTRYNGRVWNSEWLIKLKLRHSQRQKVSTQSYDEMLSPHNTVAQTNYLESLLCARYADITMLRGTMGLPLKVVQLLSAYVYLWLRCRATSTITL